MDEPVNQFPEQAARDNIDKQLHAAGWATVICEMNEGSGGMIQETNMKEGSIPVQLVKSLRLKIIERGEYTLP